MRGLHAGPRCVASTRGSIWGLDGWTQRREGESRNAIGAMQADRCTQSLGSTRAVGPARIGGTARRGRSSTHGPSRARGGNRRSSHAPPRARHLGDWLVAGSHRSLLLALRSHSRSVRGCLAGLRRVPRTALEDRRHTHSDARRRTAWTLWPTPLPVVTRDQAACVEADGTAARRRTGSSGDRNDPRGRHAEA